MAAWLDLGLCADLVRGPYFETSVVLLDHKMMPFELLAEAEHILKRYDAKTS
jgi:hypothetical protein